MKYKTGDLFKFDDGLEQAYVILKSIDNDYYEIHWLDLTGDPNSEYITHYNQEDFTKWFRKIK